MQHPLPERIGNPDLLVGRAYEFDLLDKWLNRIPQRLAKSRVILARRKSGKTAIVQRIFNMLWNEERGIIPFYYNIAEVKTWFPSFAIDYYRTFASHYIAFLEKNDQLVRYTLELDEIKAYGRSKSVKLLVKAVDAILDYQAMDAYDLVWKTAYAAPDRFANYYDQSILVILDEFQNITQYVHRDEACKSAPDKSMAGSFHDVVESKQAPMLVTGSYVGWLIEVIGRSLQAGRLRRMFINPYLTPEEGLQAVYKYARHLNQPITNETAEQINQLCMHDPFFISCVIKSEYPGKDLSDAEGVVNAVNYEITDESSEMSMTWGEYIEQTADKINERDAKNILLHLSKHAHRDWTPNELKDALNLSSDPRQIRLKLETMVKADVIKRGRGDIRFQGLKDGTIYLILRHRFEEEISEFTPDLKKSFNEQIDQLQQDKKSLQGRLNHLVGQFAEFQLFIDFRTRQRFSLSVYFDGVKDKTRLNITEVRMRDKFQRADGKAMEIDVRADSACGRTVLVEVKKTKQKTGIALTRQFLEKAEAFAEHFPKRKNLPAFLSVGGFTAPALGFCREHGIGTAERIHYFQSE